MDPNFSRKRKFYRNSIPRNHNYCEPKSADLVVQPKVVHPSPIVRVNSAPQNRPSLKMKISEVKITVKEITVKEVIEKPIEILIEKKKVDSQISKIYESTQNLWNLILKIKEFDLSGIKRLLKNVFISEPNPKNENEIFEEEAVEMIPDAVLLPMEKMFTEKTYENEKFLPQENTDGKDCDQLLELGDKSQGYIIDFFPIDSNKSVYLLTINLPNFIFRGRICVDSEFIDINDLIQILSGKEILSDCVTCEFEMKLINNSENLLVTVKIHFRLKVNLKPITQTLIYCLDRFEKDPILESVQQLKKRIECIEEEQERFAKRFCLSQNVHYSSKKPVTYKFHFSIYSTLLEKSKRHSLVLGDCIHFLEYLQKNDRFQEVKRFFQNNSFSFDLIENEKSQSGNRHILRTAQKEFLVSWDSESNFYLTHDSLFKMQNYIRMTQTSKLAMDLQKINQILVTMFEINIEYELNGKLLLKPSIFGEKFEYIEMEGVTNKFNIIKYIQSPPVLQDQVYFNPAIGFYKSLVTKI
jgi:hypothetical protein